MDKAIVLWIHEHLSNTVLDELCKFISFLGNNGLFWILIAMGMVVIGGKERDWRRYGVLLLLALAVTAILTNIVIKPMVARVRPFDALGIPLILTAPEDYSFPSGHTSAAFTAAVILWHKSHKLGLFMGIFALCMAFSRVYLAVHYPTDLIAGAIIGIVVAEAVIFMEQKLFWKKEI